MNKLELKKNKLDLEFNHESQKANTFLIMLTTGILGFVGTFIWLENPYFILGFLIAALIISSSYWAYRTSSKRMKLILNEIETLQ